MPFKIKFWPIGALGPKAKPDRFEVDDGEAERIMENLPLAGCLIITDKNDEKYGVFVRNYRYVHFRKQAIRLPRRLPPARE